MKSEKNSTKENNQNLTFPVLMEWIGRGDGCFIVLFNTPTSGTVVYSDNSCWKVGAYENDWADATDSNDWKKVDYSITLSND